MNIGFVQLHRKLLDWEWYQEPNMLLVFITLLLLANHKKKKWRGNDIERGQLITGRESLANITGISEQSIRTCLNKLKSTNEITIKSTNKFSVITIVNYDKYQKTGKSSTSKSSIVSTSHLTNNQPTTNQQLTTTNNDNNVNNDNNIINKQTEVCGKEINSLLNEFLELNPMTNFGNKTQRKALEEMINQIGYDKTLASIQYAVSVQGKKFAPTITTPLQLKNKLGDLRVFYEKNNKSNSIVL